MQSSMDAQLEIENWWSPVNSYKASYITITYRYFWPQTLASFTNK